MIRPALASLIIFSGSEISHHILYPMKSVILLLFSCLVLTGSFAQRNKPEISHYLLPEFSKGTVLMKSGVKNSALLNYNALTEEMIFDTHGKKLAMAKLEDIDTVFIENRKFFPMQNKFVELIYHGKYELYACRKAGIIDPGKPVGYGGTSQTSSVTSYSSIISGGQAYELALPEGIKTNPTTDYWLKTEGKPVLFLNLRQLSKQFENKADLFKKYVKENKVKYEDEARLIELIKFMEKN